MSRLYRRALKIEVEGELWWKRENNIEDRIMKSFEKTKGWFGWALYSRKTETFKEALLRWCVNPDVERLQVYFSDYELIELLSSDEEEKK